MVPPPSWTTIVKPEADGSLSITVYRKPTHTDQYLQWDSHHHLSAKFSVIQTLSHRASSVCSNPELLQKEKDHLRKALTKCNYPKWALDKVEKRLNKSSRQVNDGGNNTAQSANHGVQSKGHIVIPSHKVFVKVSEDLWYIWHPNSLQRWQNHQKPSGLPQGQGPYGQPKWCHLQVPMWWPRLWWWVHRGNLQDPLVKDTKSTWRPPLPFIIIVSKQPPH